MRAEVFGGYGEGKSISEVGPWGTEKLRVNGFYERYFIQPSIGTNEPDFNIISSNSRDFSSSLGYRAFFEPSFTARFPMGGIIYGYVQLGANFAFNKSVKADSYSNMHLTFGIQLHTSAKKKDVR